MAIRIHGHAAKVTTPPQPATAPVAVLKNIVPVKEGLIKRVLNKLKPKEKQ